MIHRIIFNGTWNGYIPLNCTYQFGNDKPAPDFEHGIHCSPASGNDIVVTPTVTHRVVRTTIPDPAYSHGRPE